MFRVDVQNFVQHVARRAFVPAMPRVQPRRRKLQHASQLQFAEQLFRRSSEPSNVNGFHVLKGDPGLLRDRSKGIALIKKAESLF